MNEPLDNPSLVALAKNTPLIDPGLSEMLPDNARDMLASGPSAILACLDRIAEKEAELKRLREQLADLNMAIAEYATQSGHGQLMLDNLKLCLDQVAIKKNQANTVPGMINWLEQQAKG